MIGTELPSGEENEKRKSLSDEDASEWDNEKERTERLGAAILLH